MRFFDTARAAASKATTALQAKAAEATTAATNCYENWATSGAENAREIMAKKRELAKNHPYIVATEQTVSGACSLVGSALSAALIEAGAVFTKPEEIPQTLAANPFLDDDDEDEIDLLVADKADKTPLASPRHFS